MEMSALSGIRVLELGQVMAGPFCAMQLADMGADVIKIEPPGGEPTRNMGGRAGENGTAFAALNRGKRSIVLDLKTTEGRDALIRLASSADILIENFRPGVMRELGVDYASLSVHNPRLIYASISGYGQTGPHAGKGGFDLIAQGVSGVMSVTGEPGRPPAKAGIPVTDLAAGLFAATAILAALHYRASTGRGQHIDTSLMEAGLALSVWEAAQFFAEGVAPLPLGSGHRFLSPYEAIRCADGYVTIGAGTDRLFATFSELLGHPEWATLPDFATAAARVANRSALISRIEEVTTKESASFWLARFEERGIPCGPINTYADALADPQVLARKMVVELEHPTHGRVRTIGPPVKMSVTPPAIRRRAPMLGEHTAEVLREAGFNDAEISRITSDAHKDHQDT
jgi:formyl-CoA transferase